MKTEKIPLSKISAWLRTQTDTWWAVDGDHRLGSQVLMPARENDLANAIDKCCPPGETLQVILPELSASGTSEVDRLFTAGGEDSGRRLQAEGGDHNWGWVLVDESILVKEALEDARIMDASLLQ